MQREPNDVEASSNEHFLPLRRSSKPHYLRENCVTFTEFANITQLLEGD